MKKWFIIYASMIAANILVAILFPELIEFSLASVLPMASISAPLFLEFKQKLREGRWGRLYREKRRFETYARYSKKRNDDGEIERGFIYDDPEAAEGKASPEDSSGEAVGEVIYHVYNLSAIPFILFFSPTVKAVFFFVHAVVLCIASGIANIVLMAKEDKQRKAEEAKAISEQRAREEQGLWK